MASLLLPREETPDQGNGQQDTDKAGDDTADDIGEGQAPATGADEVVRLQLEGGERGVSTTEAYRDQEKPVLLFGRQALENDDGSSTQDERPRHVDEERPEREDL